VAGISVRVDDAHDIQTEVLALAARYKRYLREHPEIPLLYRTGVRYRKGPEWSTLEDVLARGWADCKLLTAWRIAELALRGQHATARVVLVRAQPELWHVMVRMPDGSIEDPSKKLGMNSRG